MRIHKRICAVTLCLVMLACLLSASMVSVGAATLCWPVPGHTQLSQNFAQHGGTAVDISDGGINGAEVRAAMGGEVVATWFCPYNHNDYYRDNGRESIYGVPYMAPEYDNNGNIKCCYGNGFGLIIYGDDGRYYNYCHMQNGSIPANVYYGGRVSTGQLIGKVGTTGNSSGPHLHFRISGSKYYGPYYDPMAENYNYNPDPITPKGIDMGNDFYALILNEPNWKPIGQMDNCNVGVVSESKTTYDKTIWHFQKLNNDNAYKISSLINDRVLDVGDASSAEGANVWTYPFHDNSAQYWYYQIKNNNGVFFAGCSDKYLDITGGSMADGTNVQMWTWNGSDAQKFTTYQITQNACALDYSISAKDSRIDKGGSTQIVVGGTISYVYNYKFHIIDPSGTETVVDNKCNPTFSFNPSGEGKYTIFAEIKNPYNTQKGSAGNRCVTVDVGCAHVTTDEFVPAEKEGEQGYVLHTCTKCGESFTDSYSDLKNGWYYPVTGALPDVIAGDTNYTVQYKNYNEKQQKDSPGDGWQKRETIRNEWVNKGGQYESYTPLSTSDARVLIKECYYHWCIPGSSMGSEGNYEATDMFSHYDEIVLPNDYIRVKWTGNDNGHTVYVLTWGDGGPEVYCKSGEQCDGSWGYHDYRCRAWYKKYIYQDREKIEVYRWTKESDWVDSIYSDSTGYSARFKAAGSLYKTGDVTLDEKIDIRDVTAIQRHLAEQKLFTDEQLFLADTFGDGEININDATYLQKYLAEFDGIVLGKQPVV